MRKINIILLLVIVTLTQCSNNALNNKLRGKWHREIPYGFDSHDDIIYEFSEGDRYTYKHIQDDIWYEEHGQYFINYNKDRKYPTITIVPDIVIEGKDTTINKCVNLDIYSITDTKLFTIKRMVKESFPDDSVYYEIHEYDRVK